MAVTPTLIKGPFAWGPGLKAAVYQTALDTAHATLGEPIDLTDDFEYVFAVFPGGNDTAADNYTVKLDFVIPDPTTAIDATNLLITACWSPDNADGEAFKENIGSLSAIGQFGFFVIGA